MSQSSASQFSFVNGLITTCFCGLILLISSSVRAQSQGANQSPAGGNRPEISVPSFIGTTPVPSMVSAPKNTVENRVNGSLLTKLNGKFYGLTSQGGTHTLGTLFVYDPATDSQTVLYQFVTEDGASPVGALTVYGSKLYGMTAAGGAADNGVLFSYDPVSRIYQVKKDFIMTEGFYPYDALQVDENKLYGIRWQSDAHKQAELIETELLPTNIVTKK